MHACAGFSRGARLLALALGSCLGCVAMPAAPDGRPEVVVAPRAGDFVERVVMFRIRVPGGVLPPGDAWLFTGTLSAYQQSKLSHGELSQALLDRLVPTTAWAATDDPETELVPSVPLDEGASYALAAPKFGGLATVSVAPSSAWPLLERVWPPKSLAGSALSIWCGGSVPTAALSVNLLPSRAVIEVEPGALALVSGVPCVRGRMSAWSDPTPQVAEPFAGGLLWDPAPFLTGLTPPVGALTCGPEELALGPGCAHVLDDRVSVRTPLEPVLWALDGPDGPRLSVSMTSQPLVIRGLAPESPTELSGFWAGLDGLETPFDVAVTTLAPRAHLAINEVLANALGAEPAAEWIELVNDGSEALNLGGLRLADSAGTIDLPALDVEPGAYVVVARNDYDPANGSDVPLAAGALLARVPALGKNGLSNAGEPLTLLDASGQVLSRFPALPSVHAGVSLARRTPDAADDDASAFGEHAPPGASPGAPNVLTSNGQ